MARSFLRSSFALVAAAAISVVAYATDIVVGAYHYATGLAAAAVQAFKTDPPFRPGPAPQAEQSLGLVTAKAFKLRIEGRNRPTVTPRWRMCPSA